MSRPSELTNRSRDLATVTENDGLARRLCVKKHRYECRKQVIPELVHKNPSLLMEKQSGRPETSGI